MYRKLYFLVFVVLLAGLGNTALGWTAIDDPLYNLSFEYDADGNQMRCHADGNLVDVLAWNDNEVNWANPEIDCANSLGTEGCLCKDDFATDGMMKLTLGQWGVTDQNLIAWQSLDPLIDANAIIKADHQYRIYYDSFKWQNPTFKVYLYYGSIADNNSLDVDVNTIVEDEPTVSTTWQTFSLGFTAQPGDPSIGEPLGIRFFQIKGGWYWVDNVRVEFRTLTSAYDPDPPHGGLDVSQNPTLTWFPGSYTADVNGHQVYFGTDATAVENATTGTAVIYRGAVSDPCYVVPETLDLGQVCYWRVDEVNDTNTWKGDVWQFRVEGTAKNPIPADEAEEQSIYSILKWEPGLGSDEHDVYLGTDETAVTNATTGSDEFKGTRGPNSYDPCGLELGQTYYWRIDERNDGESRLIGGLVWSFTTSLYHIIDDMESYDTSVELIANTWEDTWTPGNGSKAEISLEIGDANYIRDGNSMKYRFRNHLSPYYSETSRTFSSAQDWTVAGFKALTLYFRADFTNTADDVQPMSVFVSDGSDIGTVEYDDPNDLVRGWIDWQEWNIELQDFNDAGVNLSNITELGIVIGDGNSAGEGYVYIDDIRLYPTRCVVEEAAGSFTADCDVDMVDFAVLGNDWLVSGLGTVTATAYPSDANIYGHWTLNDNVPGGGSSDVLDSSGNANHGLLYDSVFKDEPKLGLTKNHSVAGVNDLALEFDGIDDYVEIPAMDVNSNTITLSAWVKRGSSGHAYDGIVMSSNAYDPCDVIPEPNYTAGLQFGSNTTDWSPNYELSFMWTGFSWEWHTDLFVPPDEWAFVALTVAPDVATIYLYDGITMQAARKYDTYDALPWNTMFHIADQMQFGPSPLSERFFPGVVDDVRIYNRTLTAEEILYLALQGSGSEYIALPSWRADADDSDDVDGYDLEIMCDNWLTEMLWP
ncbi:MAG: LamG domain-containing protein [Planctomycetota bacterium]|jgi:hypothetical protein